MDVEPHGTKESGEPPTALPKWVNILWGTKHWQDEELCVDFNLTGQIGIVPILALYSSAKVHETTEDKAPEDKTSGASSKRLEMYKDVFALHQSGLIYEAYFNANYNKLNNSEVSFFFGGGQTRLWDKDANAGTAQNPIHAQLVENGPGLSAYRYGWGVEYKIYAQELDIVHHDKSLLSPVFSLAFGVRCDERFKTWTGLCPPTWGPHTRRIARIGFDLRQVFDQRKIEDKGESNNFGIRLVADREWGANAPTANRLFIEADVNLSKLLMGNATSD